MPIIPISHDWSGPIELAARDIVQNHGTAVVEIAAADPDTDPATMRLPPMFGAFQVEAATTIRARTTSRIRTEELHVVRGF